MARQVFFSFHHQRHKRRANQVRNSWVTQDRAAGFWDAAEWEQVKRKDVTSIHKWIDKQMDGTSVTVVLIGNQTYTRPHVDYEIDQSYKLGKGILGVRIHNLKNREGFIDQPGMNPLELKKISEGSIRKALSLIYRTIISTTTDTKTSEYGSKLPPKRLGVRVQIRFGKPVGNGVAHCQVACGDIKL